MQPYILGIDFGTGSTKAVAVNYAGEVITTSQFHYPTLQPEANYNEQDPEVIWQAFVNSVQEIVKKATNPPNAICLSSAMHSLICVDENGTALQNMITWADTRSADIAEQLKKSKDGERIYKVSGTPIHAMSPLCKIIWIKENNRELFAQTNKFISIKEYIWYKIFRAYQVDYSIASATGLFDIKEWDWNEATLTVAGIRKDQLSAPVETIYSRKDIQQEIASLLHIPFHTTIIIGASDGCLANVGSFALEPGVASLTIGTSGAVRMKSQQPIYNFPAMTFNYILSKDAFICGGPINNGGNVMAWLLKSFLNREAPSSTDYEAFFKEIEKVPSGCDGLLFLPYLTGERAPAWDAKSCGVYFGVKPQHTQPYFLRAGIEGVCYSLKDVLQLVEQSSEPVHQINVSGGFVHSKSWLQLLANITGKSICLIQTEDASALGAAYFAMKHLNIIKAYADLHKKAKRTIQPDLQKHILHQQYFAIYKNIYASLEKAMHELYDIEVDG